MTFSSVDNVILYCAMCIFLYHILCQYHAYDLKAKDIVHYKTHHHYSMYTFGKIVK